jgi:hypothetical protein
MKPCGLTPNCGRVVNQNYMNQQMLMLGNNGLVLSGSSASLPGLQPAMQPVIPTPILTPNPAKRTIETLPGQQKQQTPPLNQLPSPKTPALAGPNGLLISMGIVPGVSTITTGGVVAAAGVVTPAGMMTPVGVRLPNGVINNNAVIKACGMYPGCTAAHPCGLVAGCGMIIPVNMVSNNAVMLASALQAPGVAGGVLQTGGMIPATGMGNGLSQTGYPADPRYAAANGMSNGTNEENIEDDEQPPAEPVEMEMKAKMPLPRFHPVPTKPVFQRSEGLPVLPKTNTKKPDAAVNSKRIFSEESLNEAMEQAYFEGMSAAMEQIEEELDTKSENLTILSEEQNKAEMQEKILEQAQKLQIKIEKQKELEQQLYQESLREKPQVQKRLIAEQKIKERQTGEPQIKEQQLAEEKEEEIARQYAVREMAIRDEAARQLAAQEQAIRKEAAEEAAVREQELQAQWERQTQLMEAARIRQVRMTQSQINSGVSFANRPVQPFQSDQPAQSVPVNMNRTNSNWEMNRRMNLGMAQGMTATQGVIQGMPMETTLMGTSTEMKSNLTPGRKGMFTSAFEFLRGGRQSTPPPFQQNVFMPSQPTSQPMPPYSQQYSQQYPQQYSQQYPPPYPTPRQTATQTADTHGNGIRRDNVQDNGLGLYQSAKSVGNWFSMLGGAATTPFSDLLGSNMPPSVRRQQQVEPVNRSMPVSVRPVRQMPGLSPNLSGSPSNHLSPQNFSPTQTPVPQLHANHSQLVDTKLQTPAKKQGMFPAVETAEANVSAIPVPAAPRRPPTMTKNKKATVISEDEEEPMIRQAKFEER